jgi:hypothetical protein
MRAAEQRALEGQPARRGDLASAADNELMPDEDTPHRVLNAVVPLLVLVGATIGFLFVTGEGSSVRDIVGSADSYASLVYGSVLAVVVAGVMTVAQRSLTLTETVEAWFAGVKAVIYVLIVLVLAWALSAVTAELGTAEYVAEMLGGDLPAWLLPALLFVVAAATAFATGTSWGTMAILMPLAVPLTVAVTQASGAGGDALLPACTSRCPRCSPVPCGATTSPPSRTPPCCRRSPRAATRSTTSARRRRTPRSPAALPWPPCCSSVPGCRGGWSGRWPSRGGRRAPPAGAAHRGTGRGRGRGDAHRGALNRGRPLRRAARRG